MYLLYSNNEIAKHSKGEQFIGYSSLPDNISWFIATDFDDENCWKNVIPF